MRRLVTSAIANRFNNFLQLHRQRIQSKREARVRLKEAVRVNLPVKDGSVRFVVIGDTGSGAKEQHQLAEVMLKYKQVFPFRVRADDGR